MNRIHRSIAIGLFAILLVQAQIPGIAVVSESKITDPFFVSGGAVPVFGASYQAIGDIDGDGNQELVVGAPNARSDTGALLMSRLDLKGAQKGFSTYFLDPSDSGLIRPNLSTSTSYRDWIGGGLAIIQAFSNSQSCSIVVTNSSALGKLWVLEVCKDGFGGAKIHRINVIGPTSPALTGSGNNSIGDAMVVLDTLPSKERVLALDVPLDGDPTGDYQGRVILVAVDPITLAVRRLARLPEAYDPSDPIATEIGPNYMFGLSIAPLSGMNGGKWIAVLAPGDTAKPAIGRIHLIRLNSLYRKDVSVSILGTPTNPNYLLTGGVSFLSSADFDHDGVSDLLVGLRKANATKSLPGWQTVPGGFAILLMNPDGTVKFSHFIQPSISGFDGSTLPDKMAFGWKVLAADFDGDGMPDVVIGQKGNATIPANLWVLKMKSKPWTISSFDTLVLSNQNPVKKKLYSLMGGFGLTWFLENLDALGTTATARCQIVSADSTLSCIDLQVDGVSHWRLRAKDSGNVPATDHFEDTLDFYTKVNGGNHPPTTTLPPKAVLQEDQSDSAVFNLANYFADQDNDALTYAWANLKGSCTGMLVPSIVGNVLHLAPVALRHGTCSLQVSGSDRSTTSSSVLVVQIHHHNHLPVARDTVLVRTETVGFDFDPALTTSDKDLDVRQYGIAHPPKHAVASLVLGKIHIVSDSFYLGPDSLRYFVFDGQDSAFAMLRLSLVAETGPPRVVRPLRDTTVPEGALVVVISLDSLFFSGADRFKVGIAPTPVNNCKLIATVVVDPAKRLLSITPIPYQWGTCAITLAQSSTADVVTSSMQFNLAAVANPYHFAVDTLRRTVAEQGLLEYRLDSVDLDHDSLEYTVLKPPPSWVFLNRYLLHGIPDAQSLEGIFSIAAHKKGVAFNTDTLIVLLQIGTASLHRKHLGGLLRIDQSSHRLEFTASTTFSVEAFRPDGHRVARARSAQGEAVSLDLGEAHGLLFLRSIEPHRITVEPFFSLR